MAIRIITQASTAAYRESGRWAQGLCVARVPQARKQLFALDQGVTYLNHGSYGAALRWGDVV